MDVTLNLGCGNSPMQGAVNLDRLADVHPDVVHDLRCFPWPFEDGTFSRVVALDVIEHLPDTVATMEEISRVCAPGALVHITTPHFSCANAFTDPTHLRQLGYFSFDYFTGAAKHTYTRARFSYVSRQLIFLPSRKNTVMRRLANRRPAFYERHLCWMWPAWFMSLELSVLK